MRRGIRATPLAGRPAGACWKGILPAAIRLLKNSLLVRGMDAPRANPSRKRLIRRSRTRTCAGSGALKKVRMTFFNILLMTFFNILL